MYEITCSRKFILLDSDIDDIMADALDSGIGYWCGSVEVEGEYLGDYASDQISRGGRLILHDIEDDDDVQTLDLEKFLNGYKQAIEEGYFNGDLDDKYDSGVADVIVQLAVFGDVVYG